MLEDVIAEVEGKGTGRPELYLIGIGPFLGLSTFTDYPDVFSSKVLSMTSN